MPGNTEGSCLKPTYDGGYIIAGSTNIPGGFNAEICLIKTDVNGDTLWTKTFGGPNGDYGYSVEQTTDSGYIVLGNMEINAGNVDGYLVKTNAAGNLLWSKNFGGTGFDNATSVHQTIDGGYIVTGQFFVTGAYAQLIKFNASGNILWAKELVSSGGARDVQQTTDSGYVITGTDYSDIFLMKTDAAGNFTWSKSYDGTYIDRGVSVQQTTDGGYIITGNIYDGATNYHYAHLIKTDANGDTLWVKTYGGTTDDWGNDVQQTTDGGYIVTGKSGVYNFNLNPGDVSLIKTDSMGNFLWSKAFSGTSLDVGNSLFQTSDGGYVIAGSYHDAPGSSNFYVYLIKTDSSGNGGCNDTSWVPTVISYPMQVSFPSSSGNPTSMNIASPATVTGSGGIVNTLCTSVGMNEIISDHSFTIFPNPSKGSFTISYPGNFLKGEIEIYSAFGSRVYSADITHDNNKIIHLGNISPGIYFMKVFVYPGLPGNREWQFTKKLIITKD
ncbi:MAG TPA: T9SS type A sorting domain-containing protein [Bacteroidia bacterium]|nr:T9SS type A sorting domain-containing protein [Bacteroidia bacterium]